MHLLSKTFDFFRNFDEPLLKLGFRGEPAFCLFFVPFELPHPFSILIASRFDESQFRLQLLELPPGHKIFAWSGRSRDCSRYGGGFGWRGCERKVI